MSSAARSTDRHTLDDYPDLLTVREYAEWARRSLNGAYADIAQKIVPVLKFGPGQRVLRIPKAALKNLCMTQTQSTNGIPNVLDAKK